MCFCYVTGLGIDKIIFIMSWKAQIIELTDNWLIIQYENTHPKLYFIVILQIIVLLSPKGIHEWYTQNLDRVLY